MANHRGQNFGASSLFVLLVLSGKTTFFVANQAHLEDMPAEKLAALESEYKQIDGNNKQLIAETKILSSGASLGMACQRQITPVERT